MVVTISRIDERTFEGESRPKPILYFEEFVKALIVNQTNLLALIDMLSTDKMEQWIGKKMEKSWWQAIQDLVRITILLSPGI